MSRTAMPDSWYRWQSNYGDWWTLDNPDAADGAVIALDLVRLECNEIGAEIPNYSAIYDRLTSVATGQNLDDPVEV